jgi:hypothetical protein
MPPAGPVDVSEDEASVLFHTFPRAIARLPVASESKAAGRSFLALARPHARTAIIAIALMIALTSVAVGFTADDHGFRVALRTGLRPSFDLFRFGSGDTGENLGLIASGAFPWWMAPDFKLHFIRPLASLLFWLEFSVFGDHSLGYHLHSIAWYLALLVATSQIFVRVLPKPAATLALLVFALRGAHVLPYAWICAHHMLVGAAPAMFALLAYLRATRENWKPGWILAPLLFLVGLCGSETALAIVPFWMALALTQGQASGRWKRALRDCAPIGVIIALYLVLYRAVGGGTHSAGGYLDPIADPGGFIRGAATRLPTLLGDALLAFPAESNAQPMVHVWLGLGACVICGVLLLTCKTVSSQEHAALTWLLPGALAAACLGGASASGRLLLIPDLGFGALIAVLIRHGIDRAGAWSAPRVGRLAATGALVVAHLVAAPVGSLHQIHQIALAARANESIAESAELGTAPAKRVLLVAADDPSVFFYPKEILADRAPGLVRCWSVLSAAGSPHRLTRTGERSFVLEPIGHPRSDGYASQYFSSRRFAVGDTVQQCGASIRVEAVDQGKPSRLSVELDEPLESADLVFLARRGGRLRRFDLPQVGEAADVSWAVTSRRTRLLESLELVSRRLLGH